MRRLIIAVLWGTYMYLKVRFLTLRLKVFHSYFAFRMAEASIGDATGTVDGESFTRHGCSDQVVDPWCEPCLENAKTKIDAVCFCPECNVFLCISCLDYHKRLPILQDHTILRGSRMPKSLADKPVKYPNCILHVGNTNDHYCIEHQNMVCSECIKQDHLRCNNMTISDICKNLGSDDIKQLKTTVESIKRNVTDTQSELDRNIGDLEKQKKAMIEKAEQERDKIISKAKELFEETVSDITELCKKTTSQIAEQISTLTDEIHTVDEIIETLNKMITTNFDENLFVRIQRIVKNAQECKKELDSLTSQAQITEFLFASSMDVSTFLNNSKTLCDIQEELTEIGPNNGIEDIVFPHSSSLISKTNPVSKSRDIAQMLTAKKVASFSVSIPDDKGACDVYGIAVADNDIVLVSDFGNKSLKIFSYDNKLLSSVPLHSFCYDVTVTSGTSTAIVSTRDNKLHYVDISDPSSATVQRSISLGYWVVGVTTYHDKLVVTSRNEPESVKMIDMNGQELWSVSKGPDNQQLFEKPYAVVINKMNDTDTVIVSDWGKELLTILSTSNGTLLKTIDMKGKSPHGLTVDNNGNIILCCKKTREILVWSNDFTNSRILLAGQELRPDPSDIVYSCRSGELFVAYQNNNEIDRFQLSVAEK